NVLLLDDERRRDHDVVASTAVDDTSHRVTDEAVLHRFEAYALAELRFRLERLFGPAILHELEGKKEAASAYVADVGMRSELLAQRALEDAAHFAHVREQIALADFLLD